MNRPCSSSLKNKFVWMAFSFCLIAVLFFGTAHAEASQTAGSKDLISKNQAAEIARIFSELDEEYESQILSAKTFDERPWYVVDFIKFDLDGNGIREKRVVVSALDGHIETSDEVLRELRARSGDYSMNVTRPAGVQKTQKSKPQPKFSAPSFSNRNTRPQFQIPFGLFGGPVFWVMIGVVLIGIFQAAKRFLLKPKSQHGSVPAAAVPNIFSSGGQSATITRVVSANIVEVHLPKDLPTFKNVGGMESVKKEIRDSIGLVLEKKELAKRYGIQFNGILFYGPPGTGKSFIVKATAGEYNMN